MCESTLGLNAPFELRLQNPTEASPNSTQHTVHDCAPLMEAPQPTARARTTRYKLWEITHKYHCPIIGTCLHVSDLRDLGRKTGYTSGHQLSDYDMHVSFVSAADAKNTLSLATQKLLDRRHASSIKRFSRIKSRDELLEQWRQAQDQGQIAGAFWALMTHPSADIQVRARAYEDVHMLSHQVGAGIIADTHALHDARAQLARVRKDFQSEARRAAERQQTQDARIAELEYQLQPMQEYETQLAAAHARIHALETNELLMHLQNQLVDLTSSLEKQTRRAEDGRVHAEALEQRLAQANERIERLQNEVSARSATCQALEQLLMENAGVTDESDETCAECPNRECAEARLDLGGKRILCVGGLGSLATRYRDLVIRCNGEMVRHDGGLEDSRQRLDTLLNSADIVVCPADNVSHDAYRRAKRFCKRTAKPCLLLERSSVGAFAQALADIARTRPEAVMAGAAS